MFQKIAKHRANDASHNVHHRTPLSTALSSVTWRKQEQEEEGHLPYAKAPQLARGNTQTEVEPFQGDEARTLRGLLHLTCTM